jgi:transposase
MRRKELLGRDSALQDRTRPARLHETHVGDAHEAEDETQVRNLMVQSGQARTIDVAAAASDNREHLFVFSSRRKDRVKILYCDRDGLAIWSKRLEEGTYAVPFGDAGGERRREITAQELGALLSGIDLSTAKRHRRYNAWAHKAYPVTVVFYSESDWFPRKLNARWPSIRTACRAVEIAAIHALAYDPICSTPIGVAVNVTPVMSFTTFPIRSVLIASAVPVSVPPLRLTEYRNFRNPSTPNVLLGGGF